MLINNRVRLVMITDQVEKKKNGGRGKGSINNPGKMVMIINFMK